jgi:hypothetical protein
MIPDVRMWWLLPGLIALSWLALVGWLGDRWGIDWFDFAIFSSAEGMELVWQTVAASLFPAVLVFSGLSLVFRRIKWPSWRVMTVLGITSLAVSGWSAAGPLWNLELSHRDNEAQMWASTELERIRKEGKHVEVVKEMERVLGTHEAAVAAWGLHPLRHPHGYSYLFVWLHPAADDLPPRLGSGLSAFLFDAWHVSSGRREHLGDELPIVMTSSNHPLLRAIGYWVNQDYPAFVNEAFAGAEAADERMDAMALVAACAPFVERDAALRVVRPILDRGVGLGWKGGGSYEIPSGKIRDYLEGKIQREDLNANFISMYQAGSER